MWTGLGLKGGISVPELISFFFFFLSAGREWIVEHSPKNPRTREKKPPPPPPPPPWEVALLSRSKKWRARLAKRLSLQWLLLWLVISWVLGRAVLHVDVWLPAVYSQTPYFATADFSAVRKARAEVRAVRIVNDVNGHQCAAAAVS